MIDRPRGDTPLLLMTPGPTRVPDRVLHAGARPMIHHRSAEFSRELAEMIELLEPVFGTKQPVLPVHTTGRGAMEAAIANLFAPGDVIGVACNGKFGEMWAGFARSYGLTVHPIVADWTRNVEREDVERFLAEHPKARAVTVPFGETSSGGRTDVAAVSAVVRENSNALLLVDGVSSIGGMKFAFDEWQVDVAVTASQKCLMSSPGLAFAVLGDRAWSARERAKLPCNYWNFSDIRREITKPKPETPGTAPVHLVFQVAEALRMIHEEGLEAVYRRHDAMAKRARDGVADLGLALQSPSMIARSSTVTGVTLPSEVEPKLVRDELKARGILVAAGMGAFVDTGFRIGHMGDIRVADVDRTLLALREVLAIVAR